MPSSPKGQPPSSPASPPPATGAAAAATTTTPPPPTTTPTAKSPRRTLEDLPTDPTVFLALEREVELSTEVFDNGRDAEVNQLYENQIYHVSSRWKAPKQGEGYEELVVAQHPTQVIYPNKYHSTGLGYSATGQAMYETHSGATKEIPKFCFCCLQVPPVRQDYGVDPMLIYSPTQPDIEKTRRYKTTLAGLWILMGLTLIMGVVTFIISPFTYRNNDLSWLSRPADIYDLCNLIVMALALLVLVVGIATKNGEVILCFVALFAVDCFLNLLRLYTVVQFVYFLFQIFLVYLSNYYRLLISPTFYWSRVY